MLVFASGAVRSGAAAELDPPQVNVSDLDAETVVDLMTEVGFL